MLALSENGPRVAVVLGAAVWPDGRPSPTLQRRAQHAIALYKAGAVDLILACGGIGKHPPSEADVVLEICRDAGIPPTSLVSESRSTTTRENLENAVSILKDLKPSAVVIVSDPYHKPRARLIAWQVGLPADVSTPRATAVGPRQWLKHSGREAFAVIATLLRIR